MRSQGNKQKKQLNFFIRSQLNEGRKNSDKLPETEGEEEKKNRKEKLENCWYFHLHSSSG